MLSIAVCFTKAIVNVKYYSGNFLSFASLSYINYWGMYVKIICLTMVRTVLYEFFSVRTGISLKRNNCWCVFGLKNLAKMVLSENSRIYLYDKLLFDGSK